MDGIEFVPRIFLNIWDHILYPYIFDYDWQIFGDDIDIDYLPKSE